MTENGNMQFIFLEKIQENQANKYSHCHKIVLKFNVYLYVMQYLMCLCF